MHFIQSLNKYANFHPDYNRTKTHGFVQFNAFITDDGRQALKIEKERILQEKVHNSSIDLNNSIIATNKAVQNTNTRMLEHADRQEGIMETQLQVTRQQVDLTDRQVGLVSAQNGLYRTTLILSGFNILLTFIVIIITYKSNSDKELISIQQSQLAEQQKEIKQLRLLKSDTVHYVLHYPLLKNKKK